MFFKHLKLPRKHLPSILCPVLPFLLNLLKHYFMFLYAFGK
jgi:hypothetical protein